MDTFKSSTIIIYSQKLAGFLMMSGFILQGLDINKTDTSKKTFLFKSSDNLQKSIKEYQSQTRNT